MNNEAVRRPGIKFEFFCAREFPIEELGMPVPEEPIVTTAGHLLELARAAETLASDVRTFCRPVDVPWHILSRPLAPAIVTGNPAGEISRLGLVKERGWRIVSDRHAWIMTRHRLELIERAYLCERGLAENPQGILGDARRRAIKLILLMKRLTRRPVCAHHRMPGPPRVSPKYELNNVIPSSFVPRLLSLARALRVGVASIAGPESPSTAVEARAPLESVKPAPSADRRLCRAHRAALASLEYVCSERPELETAIRKAQWDWLRENGCPMYGGEGLPRLPDFDAWSRYVRLALSKTSGPRSSQRAGREHGRSIARRDAI